MSLTQRALPPHCQLLLSAPKRSLQEEIWEATDRLFGALREAFRSRYKEDVEAAQLAIRVLQTYGFTAVYDHERLWCIRNDVWVAAQQIKQERGRWLN